MILLALNPSFLVLKGKEFTYFKGRAIHREEETKRKNLPFARLFPQKIAKTRPGQVKAWSQELHLGLPSGSRDHALGLFPRNISMELN